MAGIDFTPDVRAVYFQSLANTPGYEMIYKQGISELNRISMFNDVNKTNTENKFNMALQILEQGIISERNTEQQYFNNLLNGSKIEGAELLQLKLQEIFNQKSFNYNKFIELINKILLGTNNYKAILNLEKRRGRQLNAILDNILNGLDKNEKENKKREIRDIYLEHHSLTNSVFSSYFNNITPTIDYILANETTRIANKVLSNPNLLKQIKEQLDTQKFINEDEEIRQFIINQIIKEINENTSNIINSILRQTNTERNAIYAQIINDLTKEIDEIKINGQKLNFGAKNEFSNIKISKNNEKELEYNITGKKLAEHLIPLTRKKNKSKLLQQILNNKINDKSVSELLEELEKAINTAEKLSEIIEEGKATPEEEQVLKEQSQKIIQLKTQISKFVHKDIKDIIEQEEETQLRVKIAQELKNALSSETISINGPPFSEIIDTIIQQEISDNLITFFSGPKNLKADTITIQINPQKTQVNLNGILKNFKDVDNKIQEFYNTFQDNLPQSGESTSLSTGRIAWHTAIIKMRNELLKDLEYNQLNNEQQLAALDEVAKKMKETIVVTETMKTFSQYQNDIGFISGSLGPDILQQINNFSELFEKAGVPMTSDELLWLEVAIINCSPSALGSQNQGPIEKYLSTLAAFAVFDEGSAEISMIAKTETQVFTNNSPQIMHLYKLNGLYFPGSYILQRMYDNLKEGMDKISPQQSYGTNTDGVKIRATASPSLIPKNTDNDNKWSAVYEKAKSNSITSINITFLSGLFNLVNQLSKSLNSPT